MMLKRKVLSLFLVTCFLVSAAQCSYVEAKTVDIAVRQEAITDVLVGSGIATETALAWLLNALGFTAASKAVYDNRDSLVDWITSVKDDMLQVAKERYTDLKVDSATFNEWLQAVASGTLDKTSDCWQALKRYLTDAKVGSSASTTSNVIECERLDEFLKDAVLNFSTTFENENVSAKSDSLSKRAFKYIQSSTAYNEDGKLEEVHYEFTRNMYAPLTATHEIPSESEFALYKFAFDDGERDGLQRYNIYTVAVNANYLKSKILPFFDSSLNTTNIFRVGVMNNDLNYCGCLVETISGTANVNAGYNAPTVFINSKSSILTKDGFDYSSFVLSAVACALVLDYDNWNVKVKNPVSNPAKDVADSIALAPETQEILDRDKALDNVDVVSGMDIPVDGAIPTDLTGVKVGDLAIPYTDAVPNVDTVDVVKDVTLPDKIPTKEKTKTKPKKRTGEFTLSGLEQVFPFCIPWDLKSLYGSLTAEAQAPKFTWKFFYMNNGKMVSKNIEIDLSKFDTVAKYVRTMELLAFMLFITLKTRDLIRG